MKILELTFIPPDKKSGGGLGIYQSIKSLLGVGEVDYIGPEYDSNLFGDGTHKINNLCLLQLGKRSLCRLVFRSISTAFYDSWQQIVKEIKWEEYDAVHIESSRYYFAVKEAKKHGNRIMVRMHNIESDYGLNLYHKDKSISNYIRYYSYYSNEKRIIPVADALIFLTDNDINTAQKTFKINKKNIYKNPVCIEVEEKNVDNSRAELSESPIQFLMTGTLNYGSNVDGIIWFLETVWSKNFQNDKYMLTIAGAHPNDRLKDIIAKNHNVRLVDTPEDMSPYFSSARVYIAAVFDGAGMKVKVAEALSYGLPVIGTTHAFIGYEDIQYGKYLANDAEEFTVQISNFLNGTTQVKTSDIFNEFCKKLSMNSSVNFYKKLVKHF